MRTTVRLAMAKTPTEALTTNAIAEAHIVARNKSRKNMKNLLALTCKPAITITLYEALKVVQYGSSNKKSLNESIDSQSYGALPAIWDHAVLPGITRHK